MHLRDHHFRSIDSNRAAGPLRDTVLMDPDEYSEVAQLVRDVEAGGGSLTNKLCLRFTILTATRGIEARGARWHEIDLEERLWCIPGSRMKMQRHDSVADGREMRDTLRSPLEAKQELELVAVHADPPVGRVARWRHGQSERIFARPVHSRPSLRIA